MVPARALLLHCHLCQTFVKSQDRETEFRGIRGFGMQNSLCDQLRSCAAGRAESCAACPAFAGPCLEKRPRRNSLKPTIRRGLRTLVLEFTNGRNTFQTWNSPYMCAFRYGEACTTAGHVMPACFFLLCHSSTLQGQKKQKRRTRAATARFVESA